MNKKTIQNKEIEKPIIKNDDTIYSLKDLVNLAHQGYFPFKSRSTILKMVEQKLIPAHSTKIGKVYKNWWFVGKELIGWLEKNHK